MQHRSWTWLAAAVGVAVLAYPVGADPDSGTISPSTPLLSYTGGPYTGANPTNNTTPDNLPDCSFQENTCDDFMLTIDLPAGYVAGNPSHLLTLTVGWAIDANDFDVYVLDSSGSFEKAENAATSANPEITSIPLQDGVSQCLIRILVFSSVNETFTATLSLGPPPGDIPIIGTYDPSPDIWSCNTHLVGNSTIPSNPPTVFNHSNDGEPALRINKNGRAMLGAIAGVPAGVGFWSSSDDCAQAYEFHGSVDAGIGGGDIDIVVAPELNVVGNYNVYVSSLTLANITSSFSFDDAATWASITPVSTPDPIDDRQWNAAHGASITYLSYRNGLTQPGNKLEVVRMDYTGLGGPVVLGPFPVWDPAQLTLPHDLGNIETDRRSHANNFLFTAGPDGEGSVYHGYSEEDRKIFVANSRDFGVTWNNVMVWDGGPGITYDNWFVWQYVDPDGNVYATFCDQANVYYSVSQDAGLTWRQPVRVNAGLQSRSTLFPHVAAGHDGRAVFAFYGHDGNGPGDQNANWKVFVSRTDNAFAPVPHFEEKIVNDRDFHFGEVCLGGLGCGCCRELLECFDVDIDPTDGGAYVIYGSSSGGSYITRQLNGTSTLNNVSLPDRTEICPSPEHMCEVIVQPGDPCACPGVQVVVDIDADDAPPAPTPDTNIRFLGVTEPFMHPAGDNVLGFTCTVESLDPNNLPPNTFWRIIFGTPGGQFWVRILNCAATGVQGDYGNFDIGSVTLGSLDGFDINPDGTLCMWIARDRVGNPQIGQTITGINADCRLVSGNCGGTGAVFAPLDVTNSGQYLVVGNEFCGVVPVLVSGFGAISDGKGVDVSWESSATGLRAFHLYRGQSAEGPWTKIHSVPMQAASRFSFRDETPVGGAAHYELRGEYLDGTHSVLGRARATGVGTGSFWAGIIGANPLRGGSATVRYRLPNDAPVRVNVFDVAGRHVRTLVEADQSAGGYAVSFDRNENGKALAAGVYLVKVHAGSFTESLRLVALD